MSPAAVLVALVVLLAAPRPLCGQESPLRLELRGGAAIPVASFRDGPDRGGPMGRAPSFGAHFVYRGPAGWGPYVGFSQHRFDCAGDGCPGDEYVMTDWDVGAQRTVGGRGWVRLGVLFGRLERAFATPSGLVERTSSLSVGAEAGAGLLLPLAGRVGLSPAVRYGWLNTQFRDDGLHRLRWIAADLAVALHF